MTLSTALHLAFIVGVVIAVHSMGGEKSQTYVVNLVPAIPAMGSPRGQTTPRTLDLPPRPTAKPESGDVPSAAPRDLPPRERSPLALPERTLPPRVTLPGAPRPEPKELPAVASAVTPRASTAPSATSSVAPAPPPQPRGLPSGDPRGVGALRLEVEFPYAWYLQAVLRKITQNWEGKAIPGNQPTIVFEIGRNGEINLAKVQVETSSGNPLYDRAAMRAIADANPLPPLPEDFKGSLLRLHVGFNFSPGA